MASNNDWFTYCNVSRLIAENNYRLSAGKDVGVIGNMKGDSCWKTNFIQ